MIAESETMGTDACDPTDAENKTECGHSRGELYANQECEIDRRNIDAARLR